jgi:hypothetical protein
VPVDVCLLPFLDHDYLLWRGDPIRRFPAPSELTKPSTVPLPGLSISVSQAVGHAKRSFINSDYHGSPFVETDKFVRPVLLFSFSRFANLLPIQLSHIMEPLPFRAHEVGGGSSRHQHQPSSSASYRHTSQTIELKSPTHETSKQARLCLDFIIVGGGLSHA